MGRSRRTAEPPITAREAERLSTSIDTLSGAIGELKQQLHEQATAAALAEQEAASLRSMVGKINTDVEELKRERADRLAVEKHSAKWRAAAFAAASTAGGLVAAVAGYLAR